MAVMFLDRVGRKRLQLLGFAGEAVIFAIMAIAFAQLKEVKAVFVLLYAVRTHTGAHARSVVGYD